MFFRSAAEDLSRDMFFRSVQTFFHRACLQMSIRDRIYASQFDFQESITVKLNNIMKQARQMQTQMMQIQEKLASETVEASVGGGMVTAVFTGQGDLVSIKIDPEVINPDDKDMLVDLVTSAVNEGLRKSRELMTEKMGGITGALGAMGMGL